MGKISHPAKLISPTAVKDPFADIPREEPIYSLDSHHFQLAVEYLKIILGINEIQQYFEKTFGEILAQPQRSQEEREQEILQYKIEDLYTGITGILREQANAVLEKKNAPFRVPPRDKNLSLPEKMKGVKKFTLQKLIQQPQYFPSD